MKINKLVFASLASLMLCNTACERYVDIDPSPTLAASDKVFSGDLVATSTITGIYSQMLVSNAYYLDNGLVTMAAGMSADELLYFPSTDYNAFSTNTLISASPYFFNFWTSGYQYIYYANAAIEGLTASTGVSTATKNQLLGEAKLIRAFNYFYLTNLFGDVPLVTSTDYQVNAKLPRTAQATVYQSISKDLTEAESILPTAYVTAGDKGRPNKWAATALLARAYLYTQDWANAEAKATALIGSGTYSLVSDPNGVFLKNSSEAIWQLAPVLANNNTFVGALTIPAATATANPLYIYTDELPGAFEPTDKRKAAWVNSITYQGKTYSYPYKYKVKSNATVTEQLTMLRLAEQYLIRAEARAQQGNLTGALQDLNVIRSRAGLAALDTTLDKAGVLLAIEQERRIELVAEWGHRWFDLKRTGRADAVLAPKKPSWKPTAVLYPIPQAEGLANPNLTQNPGYTF
ncbi:RagB/SusD family nutrient uptake outer membrane protein [Spirosoma litoris]